MAGALQHRATTLLLGIPAARAGGHHAEHADAAWSSRANRVTAAVSYNAALTFYPDHSMGAGHHVRHVNLSVFTSDNQHVRLSIAIQSLRTVLLWPFNRRLVESAPSGARGNVGSCGPQETGRF